MSPRFVRGRENVPCVAEVVNRSLKADCTDFTRCGRRKSLKLMSIATMQDLTERHNLCDVWRVRNPTNRRFNEFHESIVNVEVRLSVNSDHFRCT